MRFGCVGLIVAATDASVTWLMLAAGYAARLAVSCGFGVGLVASYFLHATITFSVPVAPARQGPRFIALVCVNYLEMLGVVYVVSSFAGFSVMTGKLVSLVTVALTSYLVSSVWVFCPASKDY